MINIIYLVHLAYNNNTQIFDDCVKTDCVLDVSGINARWRGQEQRVIKISHPVEGGDPLLDMRVFFCFHHYP